MPDVRVGQVWQDADRRITDGRRLMRIIAVGSPSQSRARVVSWYEREIDGSWERISEERPSVIRLDRFKPIATGYRLIEENPDA